MISFVAGKRLEIGRGRTDSTRPMRRRRNFYDDIKF